MKIDTNDWKEFVVGDLFDAERGKIGVMRGLSDGRVPVIAAAGCNQGIAGYYDVDAPYMDKLTVSCNGVGCGSTFYHIGLFNCNGDAMVLTEKFKMSEPIGLMLASILNSMLTQKYSYTEKLSPDKIKFEIIKLPATSDGQPDWDYMERYMREVMADCERKYQILVDIAKEKHQVDTSSWGEFRVGDLFEIGHPKVYHTRQLEESITGLPYITRGQFNNGLKYYVRDSAELTHNPAGVISFGAEGSTFFYQKEEYVSGRDMYYIDTRNLSESTCLFLVSCLSIIADKYSYTNGMFPKKVVDEIIKLPITDQGAPDWEYMDSYMRQVMNGQQNIILCLKQIAGRRGV